MTDGTNEGIIVTGGSLHADKIAVGRRARIVSHALQLTGESLIQSGHHELAERLEELRVALREHQEELPDPIAAADSAEAVATELAKQRPIMSVLRKLLAGLSNAAGPVTAVADAVTALQRTLSGGN